MRLRAILACGLIAAATPAWADVPAAPTAAAAAPALPRQLDEASRATYRQVFAAIRSGDWTNANALLASLPPSPLSFFARAEMLNRGAPAPDPVSVAALLSAAPELPQAPVLFRKAQLMGITDLPALPTQHDLVRAAGASKRAAARSLSDAACQRLAAQVQPLVKAGDLAAAEPLVEAAAGQLTPEALAEWRQRLAWAYFQAGDDASARRVAALARDGAGEWAVQGAWVEGLAAWRQRDYAAAATAFDRVAANSGDSETIAAGFFWAARSQTAAGDTAQAQARLAKASRYGETFYGLLANGALGTDAALPASLAADASPLLRHPDLAAAAALMEIGERDFADQLLRQQARIGAASEHAALIAFAGEIGLPETQVFLARNVPAGAPATLASRYPMPAWSPAGGWRVDRALLFAHALQESQFRVDAVSRTGAKGLMQLMPGTARLVARHRGDPMETADRIGDPALNFEYGQSYLEELAGNAGIGGLLPKVIAAYNAGPNNVALWNLIDGVQQDPLLFIEAIPFSETRAYVAIVLRNYWMYQREAGAATPSLTELSQGRWPRFPVRALQTASNGGGPVAAY